MTSSAAPVVSGEVVDLENGPVTLIPIDGLVARRDSLRQQARDMDAQLAQLRQDATTKARDGATHLVVKRSQWDTAPVAQQLAQIDSLTLQIDQVDAQLAAVDRISRHGFRGFFERFGDRRRRAALIGQRDRAAAEVNTALVYVGTNAPAVTFPEADALLGPAREEAGRADAIDKQRADITARIATLEDEIARRKEAMQRLGFDALWTAAWLRDHEPPAIESPLILKKGEVAWLSVHCVLSRQATRTQWTGGSQGVSFPIGHTGIRYRVGGYSGHPIQTTYIKDLDTGSLVLTNQRLVFIGSQTSVTVVLSHIVHVQAYTDALGVFQDNREAPELFKLQTPQYFLFYINYALSRLA